MPSVSVPTTFSRAVVSTSFSASRSARREALPAARPEGHGLDDLAHVAARALQLPSNIAQQRERGEAEQALHRLSLRPCYPLDVFFGATAASSVKSGW